MKHLPFEDETFVCEKFSVRSLESVSYLRFLLLSPFLHMRKPCVRPFEPVLTYRFPYYSTLFSSFSPLVRTMSLSTVAPPYLSSRQQIMKLKTSLMGNPPMSSQSLERSWTIQMKLLPILTMLLLRSLNLLECRCSSEISSKIHIGKDPNLGACLMLIGSQHWEPI